MKIVFLSSLNPNNINNWSGTLYHIYHSLKRNNEVKWIGGEELSNVYCFHKNHTKNNANFYPEMYAQTFGEIFSEKLRTSDYDIILARDYFYIAYLKIDIPIVYIGDSNFRLFNAYLKITDESFIQLADELEKRSLNNAKCILYSSNWAKKSAIEEYNVNGNKIHVVEFGANLMSEPLKQELILAESSINVCNLLFIGKNWQDKGGIIAYETYMLLKRSGFCCTLTIIGSSPAHMDINDDSLFVLPFLDKRKKKDNMKLSEILSKSHFLILPTKFDCYGIVFCEASAYGIPSLATDIGGVSQVIKNGKNGFLFSPSEHESVYANKIKEIFTNEKQYLKLRRTTRKEYDDRLNWGMWLKKTNKIISKLYQKRKGKFDDVFIPTYVINLKARTERLQHIKKQFEGKDEFDLTIVEACEHSNGRVGLWNSIVKIIKMAIVNKDDVIVICEDDHFFTEYYSKEYFIGNLIEAHGQGVDFFSGGIGGFGTAVPTSKNRYWIDWLYCTQFIVVFKKIFDDILAYDFKDEDTADGVLSQLSANKMTIYPFVSIQKDFGYSDVTKSNNENTGMITQHFEMTNRRLSQIHTVASLYNSF